MITVRFCCGALITITIIITIQIKIKIKRHSVLLAWAAIKGKTYLYLLG